jgi:hypothetical protein
MRRIALVGLVLTLARPLVAQAPNTTSSTTSPPGGLTLFSSDWSNGVLDGGKWTRWGGNPVIAVVPATGLAFPATMANVLRVRIGTQDFDWVQADGQWSLPAMGESRAYRIYLRNAVGAVSGNWAPTHPLESKGTDGSISGNSYAMHVGSDVGNTFAWTFATAAPFPRNYFTVNPTASDIGRLTKGTTYRMEWKWTRTGAGVYTLDLRIYGPTGTLLYDASSIRAWGGGSLASAATGFPVADWAITGIRIGLNGGFAASGTHYVYWGGFAVCADWCGAY